jgi:hypothetical protein
MRYWLRRLRRFGDFYLQVGEGTNEQRSCFGRVPGPLQGKIRLDTEFRSSGIMMILLELQLEMAWAG